MEGQGDRALWGHLKIAITNTVQRIETLAILGSVCVCVLFFFSARACFPSFVSDVLTLLADPVKNENKKRELFEIGRRLTTLVTERSFGRH